MLKFISKHLNNKRNEKGFTLVELIVVIAILGILIAIAIPRFASTTDAAEKSAAEANHRTLVSVSQLHFANTGSWPENIADLETNDLISDGEYNEDTDEDPSYNVDGSDGITITVTFDGETKEWSDETGFTDWD
ncbi:prepilin-type N-terminal cleavage/methylation domain-containing protein [Pelagirhabdus alkalitolerans]|uniref:Prepilin-type N-terminal cleavage/methylation domain-containing protein n=1 Tax=Pelagirhabdus alkalitolerans TaxID=1612202 RepID=A0A1G6HNI1_9BACI|nr:type II secretion system protein [Pelagirhabdus alkalitolerans]SDB95703.1 prepilin-type N-terminal cleavage/methylation domain-containing protein [Pelagirhabdus alkalitolerans]